MLTVYKDEERLILRYRDVRCRRLHLIIRPPGVPGGQEGPRRNEGQRAYRVCPSIGPPLHLILASFNRIPAHAVVRAVPKHLHVVLQLVAQLFRVGLRELASGLSLCERCRRLDGRSQGRRRVVVGEGEPPSRLGEGAGNVGKSMESGVHIDGPGPGLGAERKLA